jgi:hypothetical protein
MLEGGRRKEAGFEAAAGAAVVVDDERSLRIADFEVRWSLRESRSTLLKNCVDPSPQFSSGGDSVHDGPAQRP